MHFPFLIGDPRSGQHYRLTDSRLAELSLTPKASPWAPAPVLLDDPDPVWAGSLDNAPAETIAAVTSALEDLVLATPGLRPPDISDLPEGRARRHLEALVRLWEQLGDALPDGLAPVRHALGLPHGQMLAPLPVVEGSLDPLAPAALRALHDRLVAEFGTVAGPARQQLAEDGTRLRALQAGIAVEGVVPGADDGSLSVFSLRDSSSCAEFAAAHARALMESGVAACDIAVLTADDGLDLARAFAAQGVPLSGLPDGAAKRDLVGETALMLMLAKRAPTPAMVLAGIALSPLMPWSRQIGRDLAEAVMGGDRRGMMLEDDDRALWDEIRAPAQSLPQLRLLLNRICQSLPGGGELLARLPLPPGDGSVDWDTLLRDITIHPPVTGEGQRNLEGVSLWSAHEAPWRECRHLIVTDFTDGLYPTSPRANPLFLDSEIELIRATTGLGLRGRDAWLQHGLALWDAQLQAVHDSVTFLIPQRDLGGARIAPAAGLALVARVVTGLGEPEDLIRDLSSLLPAEWPVAHHHPQQAPPLPEPPEVLSFGRDLTTLRQSDDGTAKPQSPSRLERLVVSPLAWLLDEIGAADMNWAPEALDVMLRGTIAHDVFEHVFVAGEDLPEGLALAEAVAEAYSRTVSRHAGFLTGDGWAFEYEGLLREITEAAHRWRAHLQALGARVIGNEVWLAGRAHGATLHGKADEILELADGSLVIVDHKKSRTSGRRARMEAEWDLQVGLYRDMIANPIRSEGDEMEPLIGKSVGVAYHLMNDGGLLTSGVALPESAQARDMGEDVGGKVITALAERLTEVGDGRVRLNNESDEKFFSNRAKLTPYALTDGSPLVRAFLRPAAKEE